MKKNQELNKDKINEYRKLNKDKYNCLLCNFHTWNKTKYIEHCVVRSK